jgi:cell division septation protein DedD
MAPDRHEAESTRELRLEGIGLLLGGGVLLALLVGAFFLGRWVERGSGPAGPGGAEESGPLSQVAAREADADAAEGLTHFDTVEGVEKQVEPGREIAAPTAAQPAPSPPPGPGTVAGAEPAAQVEASRFYVQVLALRDRGGAAEVIETLRNQGYGVRLFSEREGQGTLYKVRVGGYETREQAAAARDELRKGGHPGAFVWPSG